MCKVKILFIFTSADFLINYSHWGSYISALCENDIRPLLLIDTPLSRIPKGVFKEDIFIIKLPSVVAFNDILRYIFIPLSMFIFGIKVGINAHVILTVSGGPSQITAFLLSKLLNKPFILELRADPTDWRKLYSEKSLSPLKFLLHLLHEAIIFATMKSADKVIVLYRHLLMVALNHKIPKDKISLIYVGVDLNQFTYSYSANIKDKYIVGFVGRFSIENGSKLLTQLAYHLPHVSFLIVGGPPPHKDEKPANMIFTGYVQNYEIPKFLRQMDLFISLKLVKGIPVAVIEALACGIPVVGINLEDLKQYDSIINIDEDKIDIAKIAEKIDYILSNVELRQKMSCEAVKIASKIFNKDVNSKKIYEEILKIIKRGAS